MKQQIFKYKNQGYKILIVAGIHGNEHTSIYSLQLLKQYLATNKIENKAISQICTLNYINEIGMYNFIRQNQNGIDLNREFFHEKSSQKIIQKLKKIMDLYDIIIDIHSSFNTTQFFYLNKDQWCQSYIDFLTKQELKYVINDVITPTIKTYANQNNKIGFTLQINQDNSNIDINSAYRGLQMILKLIDSVQIIQKQKNKFAHIKQSKDITTDISGLMTLKCIPGKFYKYGQIIGYIQGLNNGQNISILMPEDGVIIAFPIKMAYVKVGQPILKYQQY